MKKNYILSSQIVTKRYCIGKTSKIPLEIPNGIFNTFLNVTRDDTKNKRHLFLRQQGQYLEVIFHVDTILCHLVQKYKQVNRYLYVNFHDNTILYCPNTFLQEGHRKNEGYRSHLLTFLLGILPMRYPFVGTICTRREYGSTLITASCLSCGRYDFV